MVSRYFVSCAVLGLALLLPASAPALAPAPLDPLDAAKFIKRLTERDIDAVIAPVLKSGMTPPEKAIADRVRIKIVVNEHFTDVWARGASSSDREIQLTTGFLALVGTLADANTVAPRFGKTNKLASYNQAVADYIQDYASAALNGTPPDKPPPFYQFANISEGDYQTYLASTEYDNIFSASMRITIAFVLAHEYAHHIFDHTGANAPQNLQESRRNEDQADDYAIRLNWMLGNNPLLVTPYFIILAHLEGALVAGTHSPSACRLEKFLDAGIQFSRIGANVDQERYLDILETSRVELETRCANGGVTPTTSIPGIF